MILQNFLQVFQIANLKLIDLLLIYMSSGQTLGVKAQRFRGHTSPHRNVKEKKMILYNFLQVFEIANLKLIDLLLIYMSSGQTLGVKAQRFRGHQPTSQCQGKKNDSVQFLTSV
eukprot:TRINITY_DN2239_c0_g1_i4.p3 TRINITY_DN2239_c0_g1~~TRINITY_DN2239_c0_g1_i4.p3  ORF type:complete len:114 (-),score=17.91 TRINITY_DN2239_c0_g1_i4:450-791(-)